MEAVEFIKQKARMCDYYSGRTCTHDESGETCPAMNIECEITTDELGTACCHRREVGKGTSGQTRAGTAKTAET